MKHYGENNNGPPDDQAIKHWYEQQPDSVLLRAKGTAENALQLYADEVLQEVIEIERRDVFEDAIVNEVRLGQRFLPQFGINVAGGVVSTLIFTVLITILYFVLIADASLIKIGNEVIAQQTEEKDNGTQTSQ